MCTVRVTSTADQTVQTNKLRDRTVVDRYSAPPLCQSLNKCFQNFLNKLSIIKEISIDISN